MAFSFIFFNVTLSFISSNDFLSAFVRLLTVCRVSQKKRTSQIEVRGHFVRFGLVAKVSRGQGRSLPLQTLSPARARVTRALNSRQWAC